MELTSLKGPSGNIITAYTPPLGTGEHSVGVLIAYPFGAEYVKSYKTFVELSKLLSSRGFHVFRFDYCCTGDSEGDSLDISLVNWKKDIEFVASYFKKSCSLSKLCVLGFRLGGAVAFEMSVEQAFCDMLLLWNPVLKGDDYLSETQRRYDEWQKGSFSVTKKYSNEKIKTEVFGFPISKNLYREISGINIFNTQPSKVPEIVLFDSYQDQSIGNIFNQQYLKVADHEFWQSGSNVSKGIIPQRVFQKMVEFLVQKYL